MLAVTALVMARAAVAARPCSRSFPRSGSMISAPTQCHRATSNCVSNRISLAPRRALDPASKCNCCTLVRQRTRLGIARRWPCSWTPSARLCSSLARRRCSSLRGSIAVQHSGPLPQRRRGPPLMSRGGELLAFHVALSKFQLSSRSFTCIHSLDDRNNIF